MLVVPMDHCRGKIVIVMAAKVRICRYGNQRGRDVRDNVVLEGCVVEIRLKS